MSEADGYGPPRLERRGMVPGDAAPALRLGCGNPCRWEVLG